MIFIHIGPILVASDRVPGITVAVRYNIGIDLYEH